MELINTGVVHGRFQIFHNDHLKYVLAAKSRCRHLVVGITNPDPTLTRHDNADPRRSSTSANPLTYFERYQMVKYTLVDQGLDIHDFSVVPLPINFPDLYKYYVPLNAVFFLTIYDEWGEKKLSMFKSLGLRTEVLWRKPLREKGITSTDIRRRISSEKLWEHLVPDSVARMIKETELEDRIRNAARCAFPTGE